MRSPRQSSRLRSARVRSAAVALAVVLSTAGCTSFKRWAYESGGRDSWQQPDRVVAALGLHPGDRVADLGAGGGYFTGRLARAVAPEGKVYAVDVDAAMNQALRERMAREGVTNVEVVLAHTDDPMLPDGAIDLVFVSDTYHHLTDRVDYFRRVREHDLAPGGRVAIVEFDGSKGLFVEMAGHYTPRSDILREMQEAGYRLVDAPDFLDRQSFLVFAPAPAAARP